MAYYVRRNRIFIIMIKKKHGVLLLHEKRTVLLKHLKI